MGSLIYIWQTEDGNVGVTGTSKSRLASPEHTTTTKITIIGIIIIIIMALFKTKLQSAS